MESRPEKEESRRSGIVLVYGIPGAGKTTVLNHLVLCEELWRREWNVDKIVLIRVDYLELLCKEDMTEEMIAITSENLFKAILSQSTPVVQLQSIIEELSGCKAQAFEGKFQPERWKNARKLAEMLVQKLLLKLGDLSGRRELILIEDTFLLRSMRKAYLSMCRSLDMRYAELCLTLPLEKALSRIEQRNEKYYSLTKDVLEASFLKLETSEGCPFYHQVDGETFWSEEIISKFLAEFQPKWIILPKIVADDDIEAKELQRSKTRESLFHHLDLSLRQQTGALFAKTSEKADERLRIVREVITPQVAPLVSKLKKEFYSICRELYTAQSISSDNLMERQLFEALHDESLQVSSQDERIQVICSRLQQIFLIFLHENIKKS
eukprot:TRINITY_DN1349_c0_g4_i3.p1 TRINITY_DN1349_c0_g4~~TRINITY_DN1349_c0_g4_i3.p1  ORF type:complete len:380 (+),score=71.35 TRINITY_DN1349_c0_g4_i3:804-1943(+)